LEKNDNNPLFSFVYQVLENEGEKSFVPALPRYIFISPEGKILKASNMLSPTSPDFEKEVLKHM
jgi:hypothetical protein